MALDRIYLSGGIGAGSSAPKLFTYKTTVDNKAAVAGADYFLGVYEHLETGDAILSNCSDGTIILVVTASTSSTVTTELLETTTV